MKPSAKARSGRRGITRTPAPVVEVRDGEAWIAGERFPLERYVFNAVAGQGNNAVVFKAESDLLLRTEAVKVYLQRPGDSRNKITQGAFEAQKQAAAAYRYARYRVINIHHAAVLAGHLFITMEFFDGPSAKTWLGTASLKDRWKFAHLYNDAMRDTSMTDLYHGDPHLGNILVGDQDIALIDFGTSLYSGRKSSWKRHWNMVDETMTKLLRPFEGFRGFREQWPSKEPHMMPAAYRDVLRALTVELFAKTDNTAEAVTEEDKFAWQFLL